jgi:hypothetical protein
MQKYPLHPAHPTAQPQPLPQATPWSATSHDPTAWVQFHDENEVEDDFWKVESNYPPEMWIRINWECGL